MPKKKKENIIGRKVYLKTEIELRYFAGYEGDWFYRQKKFDTKKIEYVKEVTVIAGRRQQGTNYFGDKYDYVSYLVKDCSGVLSTVHQKDIYVPGDEA